MKADAETASAAPPTEKGANRCEEILEAASALLLEEGYAGFSARGVAARAGLRLSHVQYYFASPAAILAELLERFVRRYGEEIMARFASGAAAWLRVLLNSGARPGRNGGFYRLHPKQPRALSVEPKSTKRRP